MLRLTFLLVVSHTAWLAVVQANKGQNDIPMPSYCSKDMSDRYIRPLSKDDLQLNPELLQVQVRSEILTVCDEV